MNDLNSVLIEGAVIRDPIALDDGCLLSICSNRYERVDGQIKRRSVIVGVNLHDKTAQRCLELVREGRVVRIVGRLDWRDGAFCVEGEHVELRPALRAKKPEPVSRGV